MHKLRHKGAGTSGGQKAASDLLELELMLGCETSELGSGNQT